MFIHGFDPGLTTGYAVFDTDLKKFVCFAELRTVKGHCDTVRKQIVELGRRGVYVVEDFHLFKHKAQDLIDNGMPAARRIGIIEALVFMLDNAEIVLQPPSNKVQFPDTELRHVLKTHTLPMTNGRMHVRDAMRHAVYYYFDKVVHGKKA